jgi:hypothetical protein
MESTPKHKFDDFKREDYDFSSTSPAVMAPRQTITFSLNGVEIKNDTEKLKFHSSYFRDALK